MPWYYHFLYFHHACSSRIYILDLFQGYVRPLPLVWERLNQPDKTHVDSA